MKKIFLVALAVMALALPLPAHDPSTPLRLLFQQVDPEHYKLLANVASAVGIRTGCFAKRDRLYVGLPANGNEPAQLWTYEAED